MQLFEVLTIKTDDKKSREVLVPIDGKYSSLSDVEKSANLSHADFVDKTFQLRGGKETYRFTFEVVTNLKLTQTK